MKTINTFILGITMLLIILLAFTTGTANAQTETPTPIPVMEYVEIHDGEYMAIDRTVSIGDLGLAIILLGILTTLFIYVAYRIVVDKLP